MKIATFNINDVNKRLGNLIGWLRTEKPDVVALQELKAADREFPKAAIEKAGYGAVWRGQKTWNGVAVLARGREPIVTRRELPGDTDDRQARYIEAAANGVIKEKSSRVGTRYSLSLISRGTPTNMATPAASCPQSRHWIKSARH
jgi:exodeoxyribonuclease III